MQVVQIYFDTSTFDEIEKDVKVFYMLRLLVTTNIKYKTWGNHKCCCSGDLGVSSWSDWRDDGSSHRLLHPQWSRDSLSLLHLPRVTKD